MRAARACPLYPLLMGPRFGLLLVRRPGPSGPPASEWFAVTVDLAKNAVTRVTVGPAARPLP